MSGGQTAPQQRYLASCVAALLVRTGGINIRQGTTTFKPTYITAIIQLETFKMI